MICVIFFFLSLPQAHGVQLEHPDAPRQLGGGLRPEHGQSRLSVTHTTLSTLCWWARGWGWRDSDQDLDLTEPADQTGGRCGQQ